MRYYLLSLLLCCLSLFAFSDYVHAAKSKTKNDTASLSRLPVGLKAMVQITNVKDEAALVLIPAGEFMMGSSLADRTSSTNENPVHQVYLSSYYIYKIPVIMAQYRTFCEATKREMPLATSKLLKDTDPMVDVSWYDATAYAQWAGAMLPTEAQWEKAAHGTGIRQYPWGNEWDATRCANSVRSQQPDMHGLSAVVPVGSFPAGASPYGVLDMAGNVLQWCADWYDAQYYLHSPLRNPTGPASGKTRVLRGGNFCCTNPLDFRTTARTSNDPKYSDWGRGFRCVVPVH